MHKSRLHKFTLLNCIVKLKLRTHFIWQIAISRGFPRSVGYWCSQRVFTFNLRADRTETKVLSPRITLLLTSICSLIYYHVGPHCRNTELTSVYISFHSELVLDFRLVVINLLIFLLKTLSTKHKLMLTWMKEIFSSYA